MAALIKNNTWKVVGIPKDGHPIGCKWVYTIKYKLDGTIERYKSRLIVKRFGQKYNIDYLKTFAPIAKMNIVRLFLQLHLWKTKCYINWMWKCISKWWVGGKSLHMYAFKIWKCCKLKKTIYGFIQFPREWFERLRVVMKSMNYRQKNSDHTLFVKENGNKSCILLVYMGDMIVTGNHGEKIVKLKKRLSEKFDLFLGLSLTGLRMVLLWVKGGTLLIY